jgi:hypothetical protein
MRVTAPSDHASFGEKVRLQVSLDNSQSGLAIQSISYELKGVTKLTDSSEKVLNFFSTHLSDSKMIVVPAKSVEHGKTEITVEVPNLNFTATGNLVKHGYVIHIKAHLEGSLRCCSQNLEVDCDLVVFP